MNGVLRSSCFFGFIDTARCRLGCVAWKGKLTWLWSIIIKRDLLLWIAGKLLSKLLESLESALRCYFILFTGVTNVFWEAPTLTLLLLLFERSLLESALVSGRIWDLLLGFSLFNYCYEWIDPSGEIYSFC